MKRFFALMLILSLLLTVAGCSADGDQNGSTNGTGDTIGGAVSVPERMVSDLSMVYNGYICEHHFGTDGKLAYTDVRGTDWSYGMNVYQLRYTYDDDGKLSRMDAYGIDDDSLDLFTCTYTLYRTIEFEVTDTGYSGTVYGYDSRGGGRYPTGDTVTAVLDNGMVKTADWTGCTVEFDENGRKITERVGDRYAEFVYDDNGSVTQMKIYDAEGEYYTLTVEYGEDGYPDKAWMNNTYEREMTFDIDGNGMPVAFHMTESDEDSTYITDVEFSYTEAGAISKSLYREDRGDYEQFSSCEVTYNAAGQPVAQVYERSRDGVVSEREEHTYTFGENGLLAEENTVSYQQENEELAFNREKHTVFTYDDQGRIVERRNEYTANADYGFTDTQTYAYNDQGRIILEDDKTVYTDGNIYHNMTAYEYHANGENSKYTHIYYDENDQPREKTVQEADENGDETIRLEYTYEDGTEVLNTITRYTILSRETTNGETTTITEAITYDGNDQPLEKIISRSVVRPYGGSESGMIERYLYENGEWVEQELW